MTYRSYIKSFLISVILILIVDIILLILIDPYRTFNLIKKNHNLYSTDLKMSTYGILNNAPYDSIILGSSMLHSMDPLYANSNLGGQFINISLSNGALSYRSQVLEYALSKKKLKHVIFSVDAFRESEKRFDKGEGFNKFYIGFRYLKYLHCYVISCSNFKDINNLVEWPKSYENYFGSVLSAQRKKALKKMISDINSPNDDYDITKISKAYDQIIFDKYLLRLINQYPETNFHLIFPPYSRMKYAVLKQKENNFDLYKRRIDMIVTQLEKYSNAKVYGFDDLPFLDDLSNYMDGIHHHPKFNYLQIDLIKNKQSIISLSNLETYLSLIENLAYSLDLEETLLDLNRMVEE